MMHFWCTNRFLISFSDRSSLCPVLFNVVHVVRCCFPRPIVLRRLLSDLARMQPDSGVVLSAACEAAGRAMSPTSLVHAVLRVEQLMTAGKPRTRLAKPIAVDTDDIGRVLTV